MSRRALRPSRLYIRRVIGEEALRANVSADDVINLKGQGSAVAKVAMVRILGECGCTIGALAEVWGCEPSTVYAAARAAVQPRITISADGKYMGWGVYDAATIKRLRWAHGEARATQIIAGRDPKTQADLAAWRRVIVHGVTP